ncbi:hypothetical protein NUW54_g3983 [Trametes sanguinea]|uniref:Uncharacterized protein n=1 Tax=Trametes sanguinea TaxID=158606 RepID=A0ACC1Q2B7_9APHY|nr:hypothetical protein NUW54_g3983 [Trametes sanguinea]
MKARLAALRGEGTEEDAGSVPQTPMEVEEGPDESVVDGRAQSVLSTKSARGRKQVRKLVIWPTGMSCNAQEIQKRTLTQQQALPAQVSGPATATGVSRPTLRGHRPQPEPMEGSESARVAPDQDPVHSQT